MTALAGATGLCAGAVVVCENPCFMQPKTFHTATGTFVLTYEQGDGSNLSARIEETVNGRPVGDAVRREIREVTELAVLLRDAEFPVEEAMRIARVEWTWLRQVGRV